MLPVGLGSPSAAGRTVIPSTPSAQHERALPEGALPEGAYTAERAAWATRAPLGVRLLPGQESNLRRLS